MLSTHFRRNSTSLLKSVVPTFQSSSISTLSRFSLGLSSLHSLNSHNNTNNNNHILSSSRYFSTPHNHEHPMSKLLPRQTDPKETYCGSIPSTFTINTIRCFDDNNCYVIRDATNHITIVDPAEPESVIAGLLELGIDLKHEKELLNKVQILVTHRHWDHAGGNDYFHNIMKVPVIIGGKCDDIPHATKLVDHFDEFQHGEFTFRAFHTPCHTKGHVCYLFWKTVVENAQNGETPQITEYGMFTGDTLFSSGCGKFFEGTADEMFPNMTLFNSLAKDPKNITSLEAVSKSQHLPVSTSTTTFIYDGHEYTKSNLNFAHKLDPENTRIPDQLQWIASHPGKPSHPTTIALEQQVNIFLRATNAKMLGLIRAMKDKGDTTPLPEGSLL